MTQDDAQAAGSQPEPQNQNAQPSAAQPVAQPGTNSQQFAVAGYGAAPQQTGYWNNPIPAVGAQQPYGQPQQQPVPMQQMPQAQPGMPQMQPVYNPYAAAPLQQQSTGFSIASMVLGIVGLLIFMALFTSDGGDMSTLLAFALCAILGFVFSLVGLKRNPPRTKGHGMAVSGLVMGIISLVFLVLAIVLLVFIAMMYGSSYYSSPYDYGYGYGYGYTSTTALAALFL